MFCFRPRNNEAVAVLRQRRRNLWGGRLERTAGQEERRRHDIELPAGVATGGGIECSPMGDAVLDGFVKARSPALLLTMAGVTGTAAQDCHRRPALHKKTTIRSTNGRASRDVSWCTAPTSPGATWG